MIKIGRVEFKNLCDENFADRPFIMVRSCCDMTKVKTTCEKNSYIIQARSSEGPNNVSAVILVPEGVDCDVVSVAGDHHHFSCILSVEENLIYFDAFRGQWSIKDIMNEMKDAIDNESAFVLHGLTPSGMRFIESSLEGWKNQKGIFVHVSHSNVFQHVRLSPSYPLSSTTSNITCLDTLNDIEAAMTTGAIVCARTDNHVGLGNLRNRCEPYDYRPIWSEYWLNENDTHILIPKDLGNDRFRYVYTMLVGYHMIEGAIDGIYVKVINFHSPNIKLGSINFTLNSLLKPRIEKDKRRILCVLGGDEVILSYIDEYLDYWIRSGNVFRNHETASSQS